MSSARAAYRTNASSSTLTRTLGLIELVVSLTVAGVAVSTVAGLPRIPTGLPGVPADLELQLELLIRSPTPTQVDAAVFLLSWAFWLGWVFVIGTTLLRIAVLLVERVTDGASWVRSARWLSDLLTLPFVRRAVDASLAGTLLLRVTVATPAAAFASDLSSVVQTQVVEHGNPIDPGLQGAQATVPAEAPADLQPGDVIHLVRSGESLVSIADRYFGDPDRWTQIYADNRDRAQPHGGSLQDAGKIYPDWQLVIRNPTRPVEFDADGQAWHTVRRGESLWGIADTVFGNGRRWPELFEANQGDQLGDGHVLRNPNVIWAGLRLRVPSLDRTMPEPEAPAEDPTAESSPDGIPVAGPAPDRTDPVSVQEPSVVTITPTPVRSEADQPPLTGSAPDQEPVPASEPMLTSTPEPAPAAGTTTETGRPLSPQQAALVAAGATAFALAASRLVVRRRRPAPIPSELESDVDVADGFAEADPVHDLARRLAHTADPATVIAGLLGQAYVAVFDEQLQGREREEACHGVAVAATRHGRSSTTLVLAAPVPSRPHLVRCMRAAAVRAFGEHVDVDGLVDQNGDVLVRVTWDPRRPMPGHLLERVDGVGLASAWPPPCLVPALVVRDRQQLSVNWHGIRNVLVAAPTGQGAEVPVTALVAALASVRAPEDLGLVVVARPHAFPDEVGVLPHGLGDPVDPCDTQAVQRALESVKLEIERRQQAGCAGDADLVVIVREVAELTADARQLLGAIGATGPDLGVRVVVASERPASELLSECPFVDQLGTRLVLQTASEEDSVALLGMPGADRLGAGGHALLRLEGRLPVPGWACRVSADRLARLLQMMGTRAAVAPLPRNDAPHLDTEPARDAEPIDRIESQVCAAQEQAADPAPVLSEGVDERRSAAWAGSSLLARLRAAPIRVRCFGAGRAWYGDRLLDIGDPELLLLFAIHPITGIKSETLVDMLWEDTPPDPSAALRKARFMLRGELRRLVPEVAAEPLPANAYQGEKVVALDTSVISSDVHEFTELLTCAEKLDPPAAIEAYEAALSLYRGDLLDSPDVLNYRWMYDTDPPVALRVRSNFRRRHKEARLRLAQLLANGPEAGFVRAEELYWGLCAEDPEDERLWTALFRIHERTGSSLGLEYAVRRLRAALVELDTDEVLDVDSVPLPPNLDRLLEEIRQRIGRHAD